MDDSEDNSVLGQIRQEVLNEGLTDGSPQYQKRFRQLHVIQCREMRGHNTCIECSYSDSCELYTQLKRDFYGV